MQRKTLGFINKFSIILLLTIFTSLTAFCQPPPEVPQVQSTDQIPQDIKPTNMTRPALQELLKDNNSKTTGADRVKDNKEIMSRLKNKSLDKDSTQKDNIKQGFESRELTYGSRVF